MNTLTIRLGHPENKRTPVAFELTGPELGNDSMLLGNQDVILSDGLDALNQLASDAKMVAGSMAEHLHIIQDGMPIATLPIHTHAQALATLMETRLS